MIMLIVLVVIILFVARVGMVMNVVWKNRKSAYIPSSKTRVKSMFVLGSGGHTFEMMSLIKALRSQSYAPRMYVIAETDAISEEKARLLEATKWPNNANFTVAKLPRSREVNQSWSSSVFTTLRASLHAIPLLFEYRPDLLLVNGPGSCIPLCGSAFLLSVLLVKKVTIVFVESFCRVDSLSLSGKILYPFVDHFLVQWPSLSKKYPGTKCFGVLV